MNEMNWEWLRSTLAVLETGSLQAASDRLGVSAPTLSRHVAHLEASLGVPLFDRSGRGLRPTPDAEALLPAARQVRGAVDELLRQATGREVDDAGPVRVTASFVHGVLLLPPFVAGFRRAHPEVTLDLVLDDAPTNLLSREAEVAVRGFRPQQADLLARRCGVSRSGFFASQGYLDRRGAPTRLLDLVEHELIGFDRSTVYLEAAARMGVPMQREHFAFRSDSVLGQVAAAQADVGIAAMQCAVGERAGLVRVMPEVTVHELEVWLVAHPDVRKAPRVRRVWDALVDYLVDLHG